MKKPSESRRIGLVVLALMALEACRLTIAAIGPPPYIPTRDLLPRGQKPLLNRPAYAYVVLNTKPDLPTAARYRRLCEAYTNALVPTSTLPSNAKQFSVNTYWPVDVGPPAKPDCNWMVQHYDYTFASVLSASMHVNGKEGPVLVALKEPYDPVREFGSRDSLSEHPDALLLDLSSFGDDDLAQAMLIWKERLTSDPSEWQQGLPLLVFKMNLRNFLEKYGSAIMGLLNVKSNVGGQEDLFRHSFLASAH